MAGLLVNQFLFRRGVGRGLTLLVATLLASQCVYAQNWPSIRLPENVQAFDIGQQVTINGMPLHLQGFLSSARPAQLAEWFRQSLGQPLVENTIGGKVILGRMQGEHYLTVQIEAAGAGARGIAAVTHLKAAFDARENTQTSADNWLSRMPYGSRMLSQMTSEDGGKLSRHFIIVNSYSESLNRDRLSSLMSEDGFALQRQSAPKNNISPGLNADIAGNTTLFFKSKGKEAIAAIFRDGKGRTAIVVNTVTEMERFK